MYIQAFSKVVTPHHSYIKIKHAKKVNKMNSSNDDLYISYCLISMCNAIDSHVMKQSQNHTMYACLLHQTVCNVDNAERKEQKIMHWLKMHKVNYIATHKYQHDRKIIIIKCQWNKR